MDRASRCGTFPVRAVLAAFLVFAAGCGRPAAGPREASLLPDGRIEWRAEGAGLILVPRGLSVTRKVRLTNRTGTALRNLAARTSCPSCSSAHAAAEGLSDGESCELAVTVSMPGPSYEGDRRIHVFVSAETADARRTDFRPLEVATRDMVNRTMDMVDRPAYFEASWREARGLRLHPQVWFGPDVARDSLRVESPPGGPTHAVVNDGRPERVVAIDVSLDGLRAGDVNTGIVVTAPGAIDGDDATLAIPIRGWIGARYTASPPFLHLGTMSSDAARRATRVVSIRGPAAGEEEAVPRAESVHGTWSIVSLEPDGEGGWIVTVRPAPTAGGACIDTLRVGDDERDRLDVRLEVDIEDDTQAVE